MKKFYTFLAIAFIGFMGNAQIVNIPDANFKAKLLQASTTQSIAYNSSGGKIKIDTNNDGNIQVSEALAVYQLHVSNTSIANLTGIESFTNLRTLSCSGNQLTSLNITSLTNLKSLTFNFNQLLNINLTSLVNLETLNCNSNQLTSLDVSSNLNLKTLSCYSNDISSLNISNNNALISLDCGSNQLTSLDASNKSNLTSLDCSSNLITSLNIANTPALISIACGGNQLTTIDVANRPLLNVLRCNQNLLTSLDITNDLALNELSFSNNQIQTINLDPFINIQQLGMGNNPYTAPVNLSTLVNLYWLDVQNIEDPAMFPLNSISMPLLTNLEILKTDGSNIGNFNYALIPNLKQLLCRDTGMTNINNVPTGLIGFACENNLISTLNFNGFTSIEQLNFTTNPVTNLTFGNHPNLLVVWASATALTTIDVSNLPALTNLSMMNSPSLTTANVKNGISGSFSFMNSPNLLYICADDSEISAIQTAITTNATSWNGNPNCHVNTYCSFEPGGTFYTIQGNHRWDTTNNGCDATDFLFPNMKFNISNGTTTTTLISGNDGSYRYDVPAGTYTVTPVLENPSYFTTTSSTTGNIVFPTATSPYIRDFCVRSLANNPDLEVSVIPITDARPGTSFKLKIIYKNKGGVPQNGTVSLAYNDAIQDFLQANVIPDTQSTGSLSWSFSNLMPFQTRTVTVTFALNTPTNTPAVNAGDILQYTATTAGTNYTDIAPADNTSILNETVVNSQDPNDKTCAEGTTITPSMVGQYVHYVIRFENTGTADAINIVVKDLIDTTKFDIATLVPLDSSHPFYTRIINTNQVEFVFENINLPFDDANNDGYVAFKIKTKPTLVVGNTFSNTANIYFDYNFPIVTNTYTTTIQALGNQDFEFSSVFALSPVPTKDRLTITTKEAVVMTSVSIYNTLGQLVQVNTNPEEAIDVSGLQSGSYFIKIISDKGTASSKFVKE